MKTLKKVFAVMLAVLCLLTPLSVSVVYAADTPWVVATAKSGDFEYTLYSDSTAVLSGYTGSREAVTIPGSYESYRVKAVGANVFDSHSEIKSLVISEGVESIYNGAFIRCTSLKTVSFPETLVGMDYNAFSHCDSLESVTLPDSLERLGAWSFGDCENLKTVKIGKGLVDFNNSAFDGSKKLESIEVSEENENFRSFDGVLYTKDRKKLIKAPENLQNQNYAILRGTEVIEEDAFRSCRNLKTIASFPSALRTVEKGAFIGCLNLESITFPEGLERIEEIVFSNCKSLKTVYLPSSLTYIGYSPFYRCESLEAVEVGEGNMTFCDVDGVLFSKDKTKIIEYPSAKLTTDFTLPTAVKTIERNAFEGAKNLKSVTLPEGLTTIGESAFDGCTTLGTISIPNSVKTIEKTALYGCEALRSITLGDGLEAIPERAFQHCSSLESINIPKGVRSIDTTAFWGCDSLKEFTVDVNNPYYKGEDGVLYSKDGATLCLVPCAYEEAAFTVKNGVKTVGEEALRDCVNLRTVYLPSGVSKISRSAFSGCKNLETIYLPSQLSVVEDYALYNCNSLSSVYYASDETAFEKIDIAQGTGNSWLLSARRYYNCPLTVVGDVNFDSTVNIKDATAVQKQVADVLTLSESEKAAADVNEDRVVNIKDATAIQKYAAGVDTGFPIGETKIA